MKKIVIILISLLIISAGAFLSYTYIVNKDGKESKKKEKIVYTDASLDQNIKVIKDLKVEFGKINYLKEFIKIDNAEFNDQEIKYEDLGEVKVEFYYELNNVKYYRYIIFNIVDTTAPLATIPGTKYILLGSDLGFIEDFWWNIYQGKCEIFRYAESEMK